LKVVRDYTLIIHYVTSSSIELLPCFTNNELPSPAVSESQDCQMPCPHRSSTIKTQETRAVQPMDETHQVTASKQAVQRCRNLRKSKGKPHESEEPVSKAMHRCWAKRPFPNAICKRQGIKAVDVRHKSSPNRQRRDFESRHSRRQDTMSRRTLFQVQEYSR
jgi:hypothetical protein